MRAVLVAACIACACGGSSGQPADDTPGDDAGGDGAGTIPPEMFVDALESAQCDFWVRCEEVQDRATCDAATILVDQDMKSLLAAIADGTVIYDAAAAKRCIDFISMQGCAFAGFHVDNPCSDVFKGTVATGGACFVDRQCANGGTCNQTDPNCNTSTSCCAGTCGGSITISQLGGPCGNGTHVCSNDTYCRATMCAALVATEGGACTELDACANPMYCNINPMNGMGACKTPPATGAACVRNDTQPCSDSRDYCAAGTLVCTRSAQPGQSCANGVQCVDWAKCISNQCVADRTLGETCTVAANAPNCAGTLRCVGGTCMAPPAGMTCSL